MVFSTPFLFPVLRLRQGDEDAAASQSPCRRSDARPISLTAGSHTRLPPLLLALPSIQQAMRLRLAACLAAAMLLASSLEVVSGQGEVTFPDAINALCPRPFQVRSRVRSLLKLPDTLHCHCHNPCSPPFSFPGPGAWSMPIRFEVGVFRSTSGRLHLKACESEGAAASDASAASPLTPAHAKVSV